jgi:uncharacterized RDD family membrane protein YckC
MKSIEIKTTQNVVLQYELADLRERILAFVIDFAAVMFTIWILALVLFSMNNSETGATVIGFFLTFIWMFYSIAFEVLNNGQSIGKMAMRIRVIKAAGGKATFPDYAARWVFRMVDVYLSFGALASILVTSSTKAQRIGDIVANTAVIKLQPQMELKLKDLLAIRSQSSYQPEFIQAKQLVEEDVLLIKTTLDRYKEYPNSAHRHAMELLSQKIKDVLSLQGVRMDNRLFLQTILNDYVVLTR